MRLSIFPYADTLLSQGPPLALGKTWPAGSLWRGSLGSHQTGPPLPPPPERPVFHYPEAWHTGCKGIQPRSSLFCFIVAVGCYGPDQSSMETLDQHFSPGRLAKSITALPSWDGRQLPCPMAAPTSPPSQGLPERPAQSFGVQPEVQRSPLLQAGGLLGGTQSPRGSTPHPSVHYPAPKWSPGWQSREWGPRRA